MTERRIKNQNTHTHKYNWNTIFFTDFFFVVFGWWCDQKILTLLKVFDKMQREMCSVHTLFSTMLTTCCSLQATSQRCTFDKYVVYVHTVHTVRTCTTYGIQTKVFEKIKFPDNKMKTNRIFHVFVFENWRCSAVLYDTSKLLPIFFSFLKQKR